MLQAWGCQHYPQHTFSGRECKRDMPLGRGGQKRHTAKKGLGDMGTQGVAEGWKASQQHKRPGMFKGMPTEGS